MKNINDDSNRHGAGEKGSREWRVAGVMRDYSNNYPVAAPHRAKKKEEERESTEDSEEDAPKEERRRRQRFILDLRRAH